MFYELAGDLCEYGSGLFSLPWKAHPQCHRTHLGQIVQRQDKDKPDPARKNPTSIPETGLAVSPGY